MFPHTCDVIKNVGIVYVCWSEWPLRGHDRLVGFVDVILSPTLISHNVLIIQIIDCWLLWDFSFAYAGYLFICGIFNDIFSGSNGGASSFGTINNYYDRAWKYRSYPTLKYSPRNLSAGTEEKPRQTCFWLMRLALAWQWWPQGRVRPSTAYDPLVMRSS